MTTRACCNTTCPEIPAITVNNTIVQIEQGHFLPSFEVLTVDAVTKKATLSYTPYSESSVLVHMNGVLLRYGVDYTILGKVITIGVDYSTDSVFLATYWYLSTEATVDMTSGFVSATASDSATPPSGWLFLDGISTIGNDASATYNDAGYEDLYLAVWDICDVSEHGAGNTAQEDWDEGTVITIPGIKSTFYQNGNLVTMKGIIKI